MPTKKNRKPRRRTAKLPDYSPQTIDELNWVPHIDDGEWRSVWYGYGVEDGQIVEVSCDADGNWETDAADTDKHTAKELQRLTDELYKESKQTSRSYFQHCASTGEDPLREIRVRQLLTRKQTWSIRFSKHEASSSLMLDSLWRLGREVAVAAAPYAVRRYLHLQECEAMPGRFVMLDIHAASDMLNARVVDNVAFVVVEVDTPRKAWRLRRDIKKKATQLLSRV